MKLHRRAALLAIGLLTAGCTAIPSYRLLRSAPHKDVVHCLVFLPERANPETYQRIALEEVSRIRRGEARRQYPLYEVTFEFHRESPEGELLAQVTVVLGIPSKTASGNVTASGLKAPSRIETVVY